MEIEDAEAKPEEEKEDDEASNAVQEEPFILSRETATIARDTLALTKQWWELSRPRRRGKIPQLPPGSKVDFHKLFQKWLKARGLSGNLEREEDQEGFFVFRLVNHELTPAQEKWDRAFHGTRMYALWLILTSGVMLSSNDKELGHDFWEPGVYCTPVLETARWYGRPHIMFADGVYIRAVMELRVDPARRKRERQRGGVQWVFPEDAVVIRAVWMQANAPPDVDEQRFDEWQPELEAIPPGWSAPAAVVNDRKGPWPQVDDEHASMEVACDTDDGIATATTGPRFKKAFAGSPFFSFYEKDSAKAPAMRGSVAALAKASPGTSTSGEDAQDAQEPSNENESPEQSTEKETIKPVSTVRQLTSKQMPGNQHSQWTQNGSANWSVPWSPTGANNGHANWAGNSGWTGDDYSGWAGLAGWMGDDYSWTSDDYCWMGDDYSWKGQKGFPNQAWSWGSPDAGPCMKGKGSHEAWKGKGGHEIWKGKPDVGKGKGGHESWKGKPDAGKGKACHESWKGKLDAGKGKACHEAWKGKPDAGKGKSEANHTPKVIPRRVKDADPCLVAKGSEKGNDTSIGKGTWSSPGSDMQAWGPSANQPMSNGVSHIPSPAGEKPHVPLSTSPADVNSGKAGQDPPSMGVSSQMFAKAGSVSTGAMGPPSTVRQLEVGQPAVLSCSVAKAGGQSAVLSCSVAKAAGPLAILSCSVAKAGQAAPPSAAADDLKRQRTVDDLLMDLEKKKRKLAEEQQAKEAQKTPLVDQGDMGWGSLEAEFTKFLGEL